MGTAEILSATGLVLGLVLALISLYVKMVTDAALSRQKHEYLQGEVIELKKEVSQIKHDIVEKMDKMQTSIHNVEMNISKLLNK